MPGPLRGAIHKLGKPQMRAIWGLLLWRAMLALALALASPLVMADAHAQQPAAEPQGIEALDPGADLLRLPDTPNTTIVPWTPSERPGKSGKDRNGTSVTLVALLTQDGQRIDSGVVWRVYKDGGASDDPSRNVLVETSREASPVLRLPAGDYYINAAFGRAHLTRRITVKEGVQSVEPFVLNAGGLRLKAMVNDGEPAPPNSVRYDVFSDERDQFGNRTRILSDARPGVIIRLNSGIYHIVSTYGGANARVSADVTVEAGKLTEVTVTHSAARVTFKLVTRAGGEALPDTQWRILSASGDVIDESVGALPSHILAPGKYTVTARSAGQVYRREFSLEKGDATEIEVVTQ